MNTDFERAPAPMDPDLAVHDTVDLTVFAHELRTPLQAISNGLRLLRLEPASPAARRDTQDILDRQVRKVLALIEGLLDLARMRRGTVPLTLERVDLEELVRDTVEELNHQFAERRQNVVVEAPESPVHVCGDALRLQQVLANLLVNSAKFTPGGGRIEVRVLRERDEAVLRVTDSGIGIGPAVLSTLFDPHARRRRSHGTPGEGLGIGLALARTLVELHGGTIEARSAGPNTGSEFTVRLPALAPSGQRAPLPAAAPDAVQGP